MPENKSFIKITSDILNPKKWATGLVNLVKDGWGKVKQLLDFGNQKSKIDLNKIGKSASLYQTQQTDVFTAVKQQLQTISTAEYNQKITNDLNIAETTISVAEQLANKNIFLNKIDVMRVQNEFKDVKNKFTTQREFFGNIWSREGFNQENKFRSNPNQVNILNLVLVAGDIQSKVNVDADINMKVDIDNKKIETTLEKHITADATYKITDNSMVNFNYDNYKSNKISGNYVMVISKGSSLSLDFEKDNIFLNLYFYR
jgi:hypothetical protein